MNMRIFQRTMQNKWRGLLSSGVILHHDNASPHFSAKTQDLKRSFGGEQLDQTLYNQEVLSVIFTCFGT